MINEENDNLGGTQKVLLCGSDVLAALSKINLERIKELYERYPDPQQLIIGKDCTKQELMEVFEYAISHMHPDIDTPLMSIVKKENLQK